MRTLFTFLIFNLSFLIFNSNAQWVELDPGVDDALLDIYAITPDIAVAVGVNGTIIKTTDGGQTWQQKNSGTDLNLGQVHFVTSEIGYVISSGFESILLKTTDGGETWAPKNLGEIHFLSGLSCVNENLIFISSGNTLLKSENDEDFTVVNSDFNYEEILFVNNEIGFAWRQPNGYISKTEDGGEEWSETMGVSPAGFLDEEIGFYYAEGLYKTIDGGNSFDFVCIGGWFGLWDIYAVNENNVWGILAGTLDWDPSSRGITKITSSGAGIYAEDIAWENNPEIGMLSIHFADETTGYIAGIKNNKGTIWKNGTGINTMDTNEQEKNNEVKVYPNPVSDKVNIVFDNPTKADIILTEITGKQVYNKNFVNKNKITINTSGFPKGAYILSIKTQNQNFIKKIIIN